MLRLRPFQAIPPNQEITCQHAEGHRGERDDSSQSQSPDQNVSNRQFLRWWPDDLDNERRSLLWKEHGRYSLAPAGRRGGRDLF